VRYHFVLVDYLCHASGGALRCGSDATDITLANPAALDPYRLTDKAREVIAHALDL